MKHKIHVSRQQIKRKSIPPTLRVTLLRNAKEAFEEWIAETFPRGVSDSLRAMFWEGYLGMFTEGV